MKKKSKQKKANAGLKVIQPNVAGIDLGSTEHWVCGPDGKDGLPNVQTFGTTTPELNKLADWLMFREVKSVAMESTGVYWIPIYELLESRGFEVILANAQILSRVPGRKSDMLDCQWIQRLHSCGLLRGSFRPHESICRWRTLVRSMHRLDEQRADWVRRTQKCLSEMNVQVHHAVSDITGVTGMAILRAIVAGERDPAVLATHRDRRCRKTEQQIAEHLTGTWRDEHLFVLKQCLGMYDFILEQLDGYREQINVVLKELQEQTGISTPVPEVASKAKRNRMKKRGEEPVRVELYRFCGADLTSIDGISSRTAETILSELGMDLSSFPNEKHFVSYVSLAPRLARSGGKTIRKRKQGNAPNRIGLALKTAATTLKHSKTALGAEYRRIARKKSAGVAVFCMARKLAKLVYRMLRWGMEFKDEGLESYDTRFNAARLRSCREFAKSLGYKLLPNEVTEVCI